MLKRNLVRTGFLGQGLLMLLPNATAVKGEPVTHRGSFHAHRQKADSLITPLNDSISVFASGRTASSFAAPEISLNRNATRFVKSFLRREEESLAKTKERCSNYFTIMDTVFTKQGLPVELKYLAVVESDLKTGAVSRVGARGVWQLMPTTARELGLRIGHKYDERILVYKSTVAAGKYLKALYAEFGDWLLVMAAYNAGPGTIEQAIRRSGSRNFWVLQRYLPNESRAHVKRFIGIHYYFEGKGSLATLTKAETIAYNRRQQALNATLEKEKQLAKDSMIAGL
jgi:membrane-bound lytic murein transglycosylase D